MGFKLSDAYVEITTKDDSTQKLKAIDEQAEKTSRKIEQTALRVQRAHGTQADAAGKVKLAEAQLAEVIEKGSASASQQIRAQERLEAAKRKLASASAAAELAEKQLADAQRHVATAADKATKAIEAHSDKAASKLGGLFAGLGPKLALGAAGAGLAAGAALWQGVTDSFSRESATAKLGAQIGGEPSFYKGLGKVAGDLWANAFGDSVSETTEAVRVSLKSGLLPEDADPAFIEKITASVLNLSSAFDQDLKRTAGAAGQLVRTGLVDGPNEALDLLTRVFQQTGDLSDDLLDTVIEYSTEFRELGITGPKAFGEIAQMVHAGARNIDVAADALKEFAIRSKDGSATSIAAFKALGLEPKKMFATFAEGGPKADEAMSTVLKRLKEMKDPVAQNAAAVGLFGTKSEDLGDALFAIDPAHAVDALGQIAGAADAMGQTLNDTNDVRLEEFKRGVSQKFTEAAGGALKAVQDFSNDPAVREFGKEATDEINDRLVPGLERIWHFIEDKLIPTFQHIVGDELAGLRNAWHDVSTTLDEHGEEIGQVVDAFESFAGFIVSDVMPILGPILKFAFEQLGREITIVILTISALVNAFNFMRDMGIKAFAVFTNVVLGAFGAVVDGAASAFGWVPGIGPKLKTAASEFDQFRNSVNQSLQNILDKTVMVRIQTSGGEALQKTIMVDGRRVSVGQAAREHGGPVLAGQSYRVVEGGKPELLSVNGQQYLMMGNQSGHVTPLTGDSGMAPSSGDTIVYVYIDGNEVRAIVRTEISEDKRATRRKVLAGVR